MRKTIIQLIFFTIIISTGKTQSIQNKLNSGKPNIIYILTDDLGYGDVSCLNPDSKLNTVNADALAKKGMKFTDAHSGSSVCTPTRYGILTGRYAWRTALQSGVTWSYDPPLIENNRMTVASFLQKEGYHTACIGKWHLGLDWTKNADGKIDFFKPVKNGPIEKGFDYFYGISASLDIPPYVYIKNDKITAASIETIEATKGKGFWREGPVGNDFKHTEVLPKLTKEAITYIHQQSDAKIPFFLYLALPSPHTPILPDKEFLGKSGTNEYGDFVLMTDAMLGKIMRAVKKAGVENNTIIIFTSDNGCSPAADIDELASFGHHPSSIYRGIKSDIYEGGHRVPFIVSWPGRIAAGAVNDQTICLTDLMSTCSDLLGRNLPAEVAEDSYSLLPLLLQNRKENYQRMSTIHHSIDGNFSIRKGKWKLEFCAGSGGWSYPTAKDLKALQLPDLQLYDLERDVFEKNNLVAEYPEVVNELTLLIEKHIREGRSTPGKIQQNNQPVKLIK